MAAWLIVASASLPALAHDFWIAPSAFTVQTGVRIDVTLKVGHLDDIQEVARAAQRIEQFVIIAPGGRRSDIPGEDGKSPAGVVRPDTPGWNILVYDSTHSGSTLEADKFEEYVREEGLEPIIEERKQRGESSAPGVEQYSRCAKSLVYVTEKDESSTQVDEHAQADRAVGLKLELIAQKDPAALKPGEDLPLLLLLDGKPIEGVKVAARSDAQLDDSTDSRTDKDGRVTLKIAEPGPWLVHAVHMFRLPEEADADWESVWASLSFEVPR